MVQTNFRASDFNGSSVKAASSKRDRREDVRKPTTQPVVAPDADPNDVPNGTIPEVLTWVGDDKDRAQRALDAENENEKPRKGLVAQLTEIVEPDSENGDDEGDGDDKVAGRSAAWN